jgi:DNA invertase Pin-like site-specific DNA recombinase
MLRKSVDFVSQRESIDTSTPMGKMMFTMIAGMAEMEREIIRECVKAGMRHAAQNGTESGKAIGRPVVEIDQAQFAAMRKARASARKISRTLQVPLTTIRRRLAVAV